MAHELVFTNGVAACFSIRETPWHKEGKVLPDNPGYDDAIRLVGFNYPMEKVPYYRKLPDGSMVESHTAYFVWRPDSKTVLGNVGSDYEVVPNEVAFAPLKPLVDQ